MSVRPLAGPRSAFVGLDDRSREASRSAISAKLSKANVVTGTIIEPIGFRLPIRKAFATIPLNWRGLEKWPTVAVMGWRVIFHKTL
jgi:hypothetical protein